MLDESRILNYLSMRMGRTILSAAASTDFYINNIVERSLDVYSGYYPKRIPNVTIMPKHGMPSIDPITGKRVYSIYKVPNYDPENVKYIGINDAIFMGTDFVSPYYTQQYTDNLTTNTLTDKLLSAMPHTRNNWTASFRPPDEIHVAPAPRSPLTFVIELNIKCNIRDIPYGLEESFLKHVLYETQNYIYNDMDNFRNSANFGGIEIESVISDYSSAADRLEEIENIWKEDYYKSFSNLGNSTLYNSY